VVNLGRSAFPSGGVRMHVRVGWDQSLVGTRAAKRPPHSLAARLGWGGFASIPHILIEYIQPRASRPEIADMQVRRSSGSQRGLGFLSLPLAGRGGAWAIGRAGPSAPSKKPRVVLQ
jgi:hypothetical protein